VLLNFTGNGMVAPYLVIYLHFGRHIPLEVAGLAVGSGAVLATTSGLLAGALADRFGARNCLVVAMLCNALAYTAYTQVQEVWQAIAVGALVGAGTGAYGPSVQSLLGGLVPPDQRQVALAQQRVSAVAGLGLGGLIGSVIAATGALDRYLVLLLLDAGTFAGYALLLAALPNPRPANRASRAGYASALRDHRLLVLAAVHLAAVSAGFAPMLVLLPAYARGVAQVPAAGIGLLYALQTAVILAFQVRIARRLGTSDPLLKLALAAGLWAVAWTLVFASGELLRSWAAVALLVAAMVVYAIGECMQVALTAPLAAAIAPERLRGRYLGVIGFAWQAGFLVGPAVGGFLVGRRPLLLPLAAASACALLTLVLVAYRGGFAMKWITRQNAAVDRTACPWLVRRFIDKDAEFLFVPPAEVATTAQQTGAIPFDVEGAELGHVEGRCSFESIVLKYGLDERDQALRRMAAIIHGADIKDSGGPPESAGVLAVMKGLQAELGLDDQRKLQVTAPIYDALYAYCST